MRAPPVMLAMKPSEPREADAHPNDQGVQQSAPEEGLIEQIAEMLEGRQLLEPEREIGDVIA